MKIFLLGPTKDLNVPDISFAYFNYNKITSLPTFLETFDAERADVFVFSKSVQLTPAILKNLTRVSPKTKFIMIYNDQRGMVPPIIQERTGILDAILINNEDPQQFAMYKSAGIKHVFTYHHFVYPDWFKNLSSSPATHKVFFGGNSYGLEKFPLSFYRYKLITQLVKKYPDMIVHGRGWPFTTKLWAYEQDYISSMRSAEVNIGINHFDIVRYYDRRLFESMASGRLHITKYIPGMEETFGYNGKYVAWFNTISGGLRLIQYYLDNPEKREEIARSAQNFVMEHHTNNIRLLDLVNICKKIL